MSEMQRVLVSSSPSRVRVRMSRVRVRVRVQMLRTRVRVRVQQVSSPSPSPSPGFCVSSPNPSPEEKKLRALARVVHGSDGPAGRVGSGRVGSRFCRILAGRVGSGQHFGFFYFFTDYFLVPESTWIFNTTFGLIDFLRYLTYNN